MKFARVLIGATGKLENPIAMLENTMKISVP